MFTQDEVGGEVVRRPGIEERRSLWSELVQQVAELRALDGVEEQFAHELSLRLGGLASLTTAILSPDHSANESRARARECARRRLI